MNLHTPSAAPTQARTAAPDLSRAAVRSMTLRGIGDQRKAPSSRQQLRSQRANGNGPKGTYGSSLMAHYARRMNAAAAAKLQPSALSIHRGRCHVATLGRSTGYDTQRAIERRSKNRRRRPGVAC